MRVVVFGGYGTFGSIASREFATQEMELVVAGRDGTKARRLAAELGCEAAKVELSDEVACQAALQEGDIAINCAGPFQNLDDALIRACLEVGVHYVDIADGRDWCRSMSLYPWSELGLAAIYGCSSLPGISGALAKIALERCAAQADRARMTLFIGNRNPKGSAAVASAVGGLGRPIRGGHDSACGFRNGVEVELPAPFGTRRVYDLDSADRDELPARLGLARVDVKVGFESRLATRCFALLARLGSRWGARTARWLTGFSHLLPPSGHSGGVVMCELLDGTRPVCSASIGGPEKGQRMAILPAVHAVEAIRDGRVPAGAQPAWLALGADVLLERLVADGYTLLLEAS